MIVLSSLGEEWRHHPSPKQPPTTLAKSNKTKKVWQKLEKASPSTSGEWDVEWY
jgi:hypothetical protein